MKKYHITITENETGETKLDIDTDAIVAAMDEGEGTRLAHMASCSVAAHTAAMACVLDSIEEARKENPLIDMLLTMWEKDKAAHKETQEN